MVLLPGDFWNSYIEIKLLFNPQLELHNTHWKKKKKKKNKTKETVREWNFFYINETLEVFRISSDNFYGFLDVLMAKFFKVVFW